MPASASILPGTLDLLILKADSLGPQQGYEIPLRIEHGALYPALHRLETQGLIEATAGSGDAGE